MKNLLPTFSVLALAVPALAEKPAALPDGLPAFLETHCYDCHDDSVAKADLDLAGARFDPADPASFKLWQRVFERVHAGEMPPEKKPQPAPEEAEAFLAALRQPLLEADRADIAANGRVRGRRLTRLEYEHTVQDLLGIDIPLADHLPEDPETHGFETVAAGQQLSQHQLARYLDVADIALDAAFDRALKGDKPYKRFHDPEQLARKTPGNYRGPDLRDGQSITWPITLQFFGRLPATIVPADGWYRITLRDVQSINAGQNGAVWGTLRSGVCYSNAPMLYMIGLVEATPKPRDLVFEAWIQKNHMLELRPNDGELKRAPGGATGGNVSFKGRNLAKDGFAGIAHRGIEIERIHPQADLPTLRRHLFGDQSLADWEAKPAAAIDALIARFARRAFRRPVDDALLAPYRDIAGGVLKEGEPLVEALRAGYRAILCSPRFLSFIEAPGPLDDHAIAARLSYALWTSTPDWKLLKLASEGKLRQPEVLAVEVERLLADPRAARFIRSFTGQWLKLKQIDFTAPDRKLFPTFDPALQQSMLEETRAYITHLLESDLPVTRLVNSDFAFLNGRLARHYRVEAGVKAGGGLQKVPLPKSDRAIRGGLLGQGAILKVTADGTSTSPVVRGVFINERVLGRHIPPPPPGIPAIEPDIRGATSIRNQLEKHRDNAACASCHQTIDPPGFALENFDAVGVWRKNYGQKGNGVPVNPTGITPEGERFDNLAGWKALHAQRSDELARGFARQFLTYATGAAIRFSDDEVLDTLVERAAAADHGLRSLIREAVLSEVFLTK